MNNDDTVRLPLRKTAQGQTIETRSLYIEEWLDSLPYLDFDKTSRLLEEATRATNREPLKPAVRMELLILYSRPYLYYLDSQIRSGTRHTLQSMEAVQARIDVLQRIAVNLAYAARLVREESLGQKKPLWRKAKPPLQAMLLSMTYLSHALIFSFQEYAPTPKHVWKELHFIYDLAAGLGQEDTALALPAADAGQETLSIARAYKRILLTALADPYRLPFGAVWEIFEQLTTWSEHTRLGPFEPVSDPAGHFVINLDRDNAPLPYNKFDVARGGERHLLLRTGELIDIIKRALENWNGKPPAGMPALSAYHGELILRHVARAWHLPAKRGSKRRQGNGSLHLAYGLEAAWYFLNGKQDFRPPGKPEAEEAVITAERPLDQDEQITPTHNYIVDRWARIDQGSGGLAVVKPDRPAAPMRVGGAVILMPDEHPATWKLGVIRWLMVRQGTTHKLGIEILTGRPRPAAIRARSGSEQDQRFRPCLLLDDRPGGATTTVLANRGLYLTGRPLELVSEDQARDAQAGELVESTVVLDHFQLV